MSVYKRPIRSDELWHSKSHKYIQKIKTGNKYRYFYSEKELEAFYNKAKHGERLQEKLANAKTVKEQRHYAKKLSRVENDLIEVAFSHRDPDKFIAEVEKWATENANFKGHTTSADHTTTVKSEDTRKRR